MNFEWALEHARLGAKVRRSRWDDGDYIEMSNGTIYYVTLEGGFIPLDISISAILATDWEMYK